MVFGGNVFGWTADAKTAFDLLDRFAAAGLNAIDTADVYSAWAPGNKGGESETIIGEWMKARGNRACDRSSSPRSARRWGRARRGFSARYIEKAVEASLKRLQIETIDLYLSHWPDVATPYEETLGAYQRLIAKGKIRFVRRLEPQRRRSSPPRSPRRKAQEPAALRSPAARIQSLRSQLVRRAAARSLHRRRKSASSPITASPKASCPANIAAKPISAKARAAAASRAISTRAACAFSPRSTPSLRGTAPSPPRSRWPG